MTGPRGDRQIPPPPADEVLATDIPGGATWHRIRVWVAISEDPPAYRLKAWPEPGDVVLALEEIHPHPDTGAACGGYVTADGPLAQRYGITPSGHTHLSFDPLHVEASLACRRCPSHGHIRDGRWTDA